MSIFTFSVPVPDSLWNWIEHLSNHAEITASDMICQRIALRLGPDGAGPDNSWMTNQYVDDKGNLLGKARFIGLTADTVSLLGTLSKDHPKRSAKGFETYIRDTANAIRRETRKNAHVVLEMGSGYFAYANYINENGINYRFHRGTDTRGERLSFPSDEKRLTTWDHAEIEEFLLSLAIRDEADEAASKIATELPLVAVQSQVTSEQTDSLPHSIVGLASLLTALRENTDALRENTAALAGVEHE